MLEIMPAITFGIPLSQSSAIIVGTFALYGIQLSDSLTYLQIKPKSLVMLAFAVFIMIYAINAVLIKIKSVIETAHRKISNKELPVAFYTKLNSNATWYYPVLTVIAFIGAYSINYRLFDMFLLIAFGLLGFLMKRLNFPITPLIICASFGPRLENAYRTSFAWSFPTALFYMLSFVIIVIYIKKAFDTKSNNSGNTSFNDIGNYERQ
jgi:putative tricarboxylic transport membrane protein